ncbi:MAG: TolC family protein [Bacteroidetes bacterium]|nr:TolC family protein [Bacteroidota bacterium]
MHIKNLFLLTTGMLLTATSFSQQTIPISKPALLQKLANQNLQVQIAEKNYEAAKADYQQSNAVFLPNINMSYTGITTTNPLMAFGSKLNQAIITQADFNPSLLNNPDRTNNYATLFEIQQPLLNADGLYARKAAKAKMQAAQFQKSRTKEYLEFELSKAYMQLQLAYKAVTVLSKADSTGKANLKLVENYFKQGLVQKTDLLHVQVHVSDIANQLFRATSNVRNASDYLAFLINEEQNGITYQPTEQLEQITDNYISNSRLPENRKDILAINKAKEAYQSMYRSNQMSLMPRLNAFGNYQLYDKEFLGMKANGYLIGAQLSWNIFDGYKSFGKINKAKADYEKAIAETEQYEKQSQMEVQIAARQFADADKNLSLSKIAWKQAQEAYRILQNRYTQGLEKTTDLLQSETLMLQKELEHVKAIFEYNTSFEYNQFLNK